MIPSDSLLLFLAASAMLSITPGPDNIFVLTQSIVYGRRTGLLITLGLCTGLLVHICLVALGLAAILKTSTLAFTILKVVGVSYLLYLAWQSFQARNAMSLAQTDDSAADLSLYGRGILMNLGNPKIAIFFLAFLPQFTSPSRGSVALQVLILGAVFVATTIIVFGLIAWSASHIGQWLKRFNYAQSLLNRLAGAVFIVLACRLAISKP